MATDWIMIRVSRETHERLEAVRTSMLIGNEMGVRELQFDNRDRVSLDQVISELIYFRSKHADRRKRSAARRRAARRRAGQQLDQAADVGGLVELLDQAADVGGLDKQQKQDFNQRISDTVSVCNSLFQREASE